MHRLPWSKIDFDINNVKIGSKIYPADAHCITNSTSTIMIPTSDIYRLCQLLLKNKVCWMIIFILTTAVVVTTVAIHTHYHFNPSFKEQDKPIVSPARNLTWKNYWPAAPPSASRSGRKPRDLRRLADYTSLTGDSHQLWRRVYTLSITLF